MHINTPPPVFVLLHACMSGISSASWHRQMVFVCCSDHHPSTFGLYDSLLDSAACRGSYWALHDTSSDSWIAYHYSTAKLSPLLHHGLRAISLYSGDSDERSASECYGTPDSYVLMQGFHPWPGSFSQLEPNAMVLQRSGNSGHRSFSNHRNTHMSFWPGLSLLRTLFGHSRIWLLQDHQL